jgi:isopropylmalate/homocitrate/citramalate synthase
MDRVTLCECFARDGLQHEPAFVPTAGKRRLVERFAALGFPRVEATSYSNPKVVPQFADASELLRSLERKPGVHYKAAEFTWLGRMTSIREVCSADAPSEPVAISKDGT